MDWSIYYCQTGELNKIIGGKNPINFNTPKGVGVSRIETNEDAETNQQIEDGINNKSPGETGKDQINKFLLLTAWIKIELLMILFPNQQAFP